MSWLDKYKEELAAISSKGNKTKSKSAFDIATLVARTPATYSDENSEWDTYNPFQKLIYAENTNRVLDVLSRGMYATASFADEIRAQADAGEKRGQPLNFWDVDKGKAFGAAVEGIEGQSKKSFGEVNQNWENSLPEDRRKALNDAPGSAWAKGISAFIMDVGLDPTTYMGAGPIKSLAKASGIKMPSAVKNAVHEIIPAKSVVANTAMEEAKIAIPKLDWTKDLKAPVEGATVSPKGVQAVLEAQRAGLEDTLAKVPGLRYKDLATNDIPSIFKDTITKRPSVKTIEEFITVPGRAAKESAIYNAVKRVILQEPKFEKLAKQGSKTTSAPQLDELVKKVIADPAAMASASKSTIKLVGRSGNTHDIPFSSYVRMLETGRMPKSIVGIKELFIPKHGKAVPVPEYVASKKAKYAIAAAPKEEKVVKQLEAVIEEVKTSSKMTKKELQEWKDSIKHLVDSEDLDYIAASTSKTMFKNRLQELVTKQKPLGIKTLDDLEAAVIAGKVSPLEAKQAYLAFGKARTYKGASKFLANLNSRIDNISIPKADELVEAAAKGDSKALEFIPTTLTPAEKRVVSSIITRVVDKEFINPKTWKFKSKTGTLRTSSTLREGLGRNLQGFNKFSQYTLHAEIMREVANMVKLTEAAAPAKFTRAERMTYVYDKYMKLLKASEDTLMSRGISPIVGHGQRGLPLSLHDVLSVLPRQIVEHRMMDRLRHVPPTAILDAAGSIAYRISKGMEIGDETVSIVTKALMQDITGNTFRSSILKGMDAGGKSALMSKSDLDRLVRHFIKAGPKFAAAVERNSARAGIKYGQYVEAIRKETIDTLIKDVSTSIGNSANILKIVDDLPKYIENAVKAVDEPVLRGAPEQVLAEATSTLDDIIPVAAVKSGIQADKAFLEKGINPGLSRLDDAAKTVDELNLPKEYMSDFSERLSLIQTVAFLRNIFPHMANKDLRPFLLAHENAAKAVSTKYSIQLSKISRFGDSNIKEAWKNIQDGVKAVDPESAVGQAQIELAQAMSTIFNMGPNGGVISMSGLTADAVNAKMRHFGIPDSFRLEGNTLAEALTSYSSWDNVKDPLDLLSRVHTAVRSAQADKLLADSIIREFGSKTLTPTHNVKIVNAEKSIIGKMLEGHYFTADIANQVRVLETSIKELMKPPSTSKIMRLYDSAIHSYKAGLTIYVPAHHMRNLYGDIWLASMDGLFNPKYYQQSMKVLKTRKSNYKDFNPDVFNIGNLDEGAPIVTLSYNGKPVKLNADNLYRLATGKGVLTDYTVLEDLAVGASDNVLKTSVSAHIEKISPLKGKLHNRVTQFSEYREHYVRMAHFIYALEEESILKGKTLQDAIESAAHAASARVRKWHPDGSDYSAFERNKLRRAVLFYSWIRKAIPLVIESALTRPGRFMMYPKAMYNMAAANGIAIDSPSDPFPVDQLFPSWMKEQVLGPQIGKSGAYFGIKQGVPGPDVLEQYFTSPLGTTRTLASSITPAVKLPFEIATQTSVRTGAPIGDIPGWMLDQIPYGNRINDTLGGPVGVEAKSNVGYEPQLDIPGGFTLDKRGITGLNWLTGLGITDMSKPSYIRSANIEKRKKK